MEPTTTEEMHVEPMVADSQDDTLVDDTPAFVDMNDVEEVKVDDDLPMEEEDDDAGNENAVEDIEPVIDMSKAKNESHTDAVYAVACSVENAW